ncbi:DUF2513 domain-containing protein [Vibrio vulnificus]|uniref:DUF2513 domain-containing protein n=1 Tax=Vibrio TaxID=662 RepID=UPI00128DE96B|nr:DUF2513 domain-containing protein [Vibrio sp. VGrn 2]EGQ9976466.1 DUF2513 domain-containing protein [Vibrio vulnificus]MPS41661.1 DUF2513 domain-containing protein [Vibrio sp. VGrn 2]HAS8129050.1 DUF2513 domain-containing protein [Vibrio vulnificus]
MKIDKEYLKSLLEAFESAEGPLTNIRELEAKGFHYDDDKFAFHTDLLVDKGYIESFATQQSRGAGYRLMGSGERVWSVVPLRLTAFGHDFIESLNEPNVWREIQTNFKDASLDTTISVAKDLAKGYAKQKVKSLLDAAGS